MAEFSDRSKVRLAQCHQDLQRVFNRVIAHYDCSIITGHRSEADQNKMFDDQLSKVEWPDSKHNSVPSMAVDCVRYHNGIRWNDTKGHYHFAGFVMGLAASMGIKLRSGSDWDMDMDLDDQSFNDLIHFELVD